MSWKVKRTKRRKKFSFVAFADWKKNTVTSALRLISRNPLGKYSCFFFTSRTKFALNALEPRGSQERNLKFEFRFSEDVYVMKDPFSPKNRNIPTNYLLLGGTCSICKNSVCADSVKKNIEHFCCKNFIDLLFYLANMQHFLRSTVLSSMRD